MISRLTTGALTTVLSLAAFVGIFITPASAQEYQVTVTLTGDTSIPAPLSYTFDTTTPFQLTGNVAITNLSVIFDPECGSKCSVDSVEYNANESEISYDDGTFWYQSAVGCSTAFYSGSCTVNPGLNVTGVGTYWAATGSITVSPIPNKVPSLPEPSSYLELAGMGFGLAFWRFRRFSSKQRA